MANSSTIYSFNDKDCPDNPIYLQDYFTNTATLEKKFRKLNNKKSFGIDGIPNIILKHIPLNMIRAYFSIYTFQ